MLGTILLCKMLEIALTFLSGRRFSRVVGKAKTNCWSLHLEGSVLDIIDRWHYGWRNTFSAIDRKISAGGRVLSPICEPGSRSKCIIRPKKDTTEEL